MIAHMPGIVKVYLLSIYMRHVYIIIKFPHICRRYKLFFFSRRRRKISQQRSVMHMSGQMPQFLSDRSETKYLNSELNKRHLWCLLNFSGSLVCTDMSYCMWYLARNFTDQLTFLLLSKLPASPLKMKTKLVKSHFSHTIWTGRWTHLPESTFWSLHFHGYLFIILP